MVAIDPTEALVAIDVNSAKSKSGDDLEQAALNTNLEAVDEIAHQLQLRDIGGLIVIDFIDMDQSANRQTVENRMADALSEDYANISWTRISRFGLMELQRQRLHPALHETFFEACPQCEGHGRIRNVDSVALSVLRKVEHTAGKSTCSSVQAHTPSEVATYLLNEKRQDVALIEERTGVHVLVLPQADLNRPDYRVLQFDEDDTLSNHTIASYEHPVPHEESSLGHKSPKKDSVNNSVPIISSQSQRTNSSTKTSQHKKAQAKKQPNKQKQEPLLLRVLSRMFSSKPEPVITKHQKHKSKLKEDRTVNNEGKMSHESKQKAKKDKQHKDTTNKLQNTNKQQQDSQRQRKRQSQTTQKPQTLQKPQQKERGNNVQTADARKSKDRAPKKSSQSNRHINDGQSSHPVQQVDVEDQVKDQRTKSRKTDTRNLETDVSTRKTSHTNKRQRSRTKRTSVEEEPSVAAIFNEWNKEEPDKNATKSMRSNNQLIEKSEPGEEITMTKADSGAAVSSKPRAQANRKPPQKTQSRKRTPQSESACNEPHERIDQTQVLDTIEPHSSPNDGKRDSSLQFPTEQSSVITASTESFDTERKNPESNQEKTLVNIKEHVSDSTFDSELQNPGGATNEPVKRASNDPRLRRG